MLDSDLTQDINQVLYHWSQCQCPGVNLLTQSWIKPNNFQGCGKRGRTVKWDKTANEIMYGAIMDCWKKKSSFHLLKMEMLWISAGRSRGGNGTHLCIYSWNWLKCNTTISACNTTKAPWGKKFCFSRNPPVHFCGQRSRFQSLASLEKYFWCSLSFTWGTNSYLADCLGHQLFLSLNISVHNSLNCSFQKEKVGDPPALPKPAIAISHWACPLWQQ